MNILDFINIFVGMPGFLWNFVVAVGWWWFLITFVFWLIYIAFQVVRKKYDNTSGWKHWCWGVVGVCLLIVGFPTDVVYQHTIAWAVFKDAPKRKEWTLTARLSRYVTLGKKKAGETWFGISRFKLADFVCTRMLDPWQLGGHCRRAT